MIQEDFVRRSPKYSVDCADTLSASIARNTFLTLVVTSIENEETMTLLYTFVLSQSGITQLQRHFVK